MTEETDEQTLHIGPDSLTQLQTFLTNRAFSRFVVLADENTLRYCYPLLKPYLPAHDILQIRSGEQHKSLETCQIIWDGLTQLEADRWTVLINLGGGVIGDMGGFCAATFKRGIYFVQVPTTLLAQVDASIGGKLGIDYHGYKNHLGLYQEPAGIFMYPDFLKTLPLEQIKSGYAEVVKHWLVADADQFQQQRYVGLFAEDWAPIVQESVRVKSAIVAADPLEGGYRKILNFGHTIGHAIESYFLTHRPQEPLLHGYCVAIGMICEGYISVQKGLLPEVELDKIVAFLVSIYEQQELKTNQLEAIADLTLQDKKNVGGNILCTLLEQIGKAVYNQAVSRAEIMVALTYYQTL